MCMLENSCIADSVWCFAGHWDHLISIMLSPPWRMGLAWNTCTDFSTSLSCSYRLQFNLILLHTRQRSQSLPERCPQTNSGQKKSTNITSLHSLTTFTFLKVLFQGLCSMYTHICACWWLWPNYYSWKCKYTRICLGLIRNSIVFCVFSERNSSEAVGDQPTGHWCHPRGTFCPAGDRRSKLWHVQSFIFFRSDDYKIIWPDFEVFLDIIPV